MVEYGKINMAAHNQSFIAGKDGIQSLESTGKDGIQSLGSLDDAAILHGVAMSLKQDQLEQLKVHLANSFPLVKEKVMGDEYFAHRFCDYLPVEAINAAKQYLRKQFREQYEQQKNRTAISPSNTRPLELDREKGDAEYLL